MKRLFVDGHFLDGNFHGVATFVEYLYKEVSVQAPGFEITIGAYNVDYVSDVFKNYSNVNVIPYKSRSKLRLLYDIPLILYKGNFDLAIFQYAIPFFIPKSCKVLVTIHDILYKDVPNEFGFFYKLLRNITFKYAAVKSDMITTVSDYSSRAVVEHFEISPDKVYTIPCGLSDEFICNYDVDYEKTKIYNELSISNDFILYVSRVEPRKNHDFLLRVYLDMKLYMQDIDLVFVGKIYDENVNFTNLLNNLTPHQAKHIHILSDLSFEQLVSLYVACRLSVYPSKAEGFGIPILESLALGKPTIFSQTTAMLEFDFCSNYFIDPLNTESLKTSIEKELVFGLYTQSELMGIKRYVMKNYSWSLSAKKLLKLLN